MNIIATGNPSRQVPLADSAPTQDFDPVLTQYADDIRTFGRSTIDNVIAIGRLLVAARERVGHGRWKGWLDREFRWSDRTALNFIRVFELAESKSENFSDLNLPLSGLYLLAAHSTPETARDEIFRRAETGEKITVNNIQEVVEAAQPGEDFAQDIAAKKQNPPLVEVEREAIAADVATTVTPAAAPDTSASSAMGTSDNKFDASEIKTSGTTAPVIKSRAQVKSAKAAIEEDRPADRKSSKRLSRSTRWIEAVTAAGEALRELQELQQEYQDWRDSLPENLQDSSVAEKLDAVCELDLESALSTIEEAEGLDLPLGYGRD